ncbi:MAG: DUF2059 domain-containing protein [Desulfobacteraceae bacterium]|nr:DUF2059 domain-containing protein [Desulfobacteraceae bacterium]
MKTSKFHILVLSITLVFTLIPLNATAKEQANIKAAYELFDAMELATTFEQTIKKIVDMQIQQNPQIGPFRKVMLDFFAKYMGWESLKADMAKIYIDKFSIEELVKLKEFYQTPLGKKTARLLPELTAEGGALGQKRVQDNIVELQKMIAAEEQRIKANQ